jgi:hypothetical protein
MSASQERISYVELVKLVALDEETKGMCELNEILLDLVAETTGRSCSRGRRCLPERPLKQCIWAETSGGRRECEFPPETAQRWDEADGEWQSYTFCSMQISVDPLRVMANIHNWSWSFSIAARLQLGWPKKETFSSPQCSDSLLYIAYPWFFLGEEAARAWI